MTDKKLFSSLSGLVIGVFAGAGIIAAPTAAFADHHNEHDHDQEEAGEKSCSGDKKCSGEKKADTSDEKADTSDKKADTSDKKCSGEKGCAGKM